MAARLIFSSRGSITAALMAAAARDYLDYFLGNP
jgi:hypothetical protein